MFKYFIMQIFVYCFAINSYAAVPTVDQILTATHFFEVLGFSSNESLTDHQVKLAYRKAASAYHPDKINDPRANDVSVKIREAFENLETEVLRKNYIRSGMTSNSYNNISARRTNRTYYNRWHPTAEEDQARKTYYKSEIEAMSVEAKKYSNEDYIYHPGKIAFFDRRVNAWSYYSPNINTRFGLRNFVTNEGWLFSFKDGRYTSKIFNAEMDLQSRAWFLKVNSSESQQIEVNPYNGFLVRAEKKYITYKNLSLFEKSLDVIFNPVVLALDINRESDIRASFIKDELSETMSEEKYKEYLSRTKAYIDLLTDPSSERGGIGDYNKFQILALLDLDIARDSIELYRYFLENMLEFLHKDFVQILLSDIKWTGHKNFDLWIKIIFKNTKLALSFMESLFLQNNFAEFNLSQFLVKNHELIVQSKPGVKLYTWFLNFARESSGDKVNVSDFDVNKNLFLSLSETSSFRKLVAKTNIEEEELVRTHLKWLSTYNQELAEAAEHALDSVEGVIRSNFNRWQDDDKTKLEFDQKAYKKAVKEVSSQRLSLIKNELSRYSSGDVKACQAVVSGTN